MNILCDACGGGEATFYCAADDASLCTACDHRVHHASEVAKKHRRVSLRQPSPQPIPVCDICQEREAFLFCQQDRAILCRNCDISIHNANQHTRQHTRFLLAGCIGGAAAPTSTTPPAKGATPAAGAEDSSLSECLMEMLPGWHVEDVLGPSRNCQSDEIDLVLRFLDDDDNHFNQFPLQQQTQRDQELFGGIFY